MRLARQAGTALATAATSVSSTATAAMASGSGVTPKIQLEMICDPIVRASAGQVAPAPLREPDPENDAQRDGRPRS